jgi:hypothetical protein
MGVLSSAGLENAWARRERGEVYTKLCSPARCPRMGDNTLRAHECLFDARQSTPVRHRDSPFSANWRSEWRVSPYRCRSIDWTAVGSHLALKPADRTHYGPAATVLSSAAKSIPRNQIHATESATLGWHESRNGFRRRDSDSMTMSAQSASRFGPACLPLRISGRTCFVSRSDAESVRGAYPVQLLRGPGRTITTLAVWPCSRFRPPTGPISPAQNMPATGTLPPSADCSGRMSPSASP